MTRSAKELRYLLAYIPVDKLSLTEHTTASAKMMDDYGETLRGNS